MIKVAAAIILNENKILIARRFEGDRLGGKWEFPGGKIEKDETPEECLIRELKEEFDLAIEVTGFFDEVTHEYDFAKIHLRFYFAKISSGSIRSNAHQEYKWAGAENLKEYDFAPADMSIIDKLSTLK